MIAVGTVRANSKQQTANSQLSRLQIADKIASRHFGSRIRAHEYIWLRLFAVCYLLSPTLFAVCCAFSLCLDLSNLSRWPDSKPYAQFASFRKEQGKSGDFVGVLQLPAMQSSLKSMGITIAHQRMAIFSAPYLSVIGLPTSGGSIWHTMMNRLREAGS